MCSYSPRITAPTESRSRFNARPKVLVAPSFRRVVNSLGQPIEGQGPILAKMTDVIEKVAPAWSGEKSVSQPCRPG